MRVIDVPQRSLEWFQARCGRLTSSDAGAMLATIKSGEAAARRDLRLRLVCERLTGQPAASDYTNADMQRGVELEPEAIAKYETAIGRAVQFTGFCAHDTLLAGCSLDGHLGDFDTLVEVKCPKAATHLRYLQSREVPTEYLGQLAHQLWMTGAQAVDFVSYDPRFPPALQLCIRQYTSREANLPAYEKAVLAFLAEVDRDLDVVNTLSDLRGQLEAAL